MTFALKFHEPNRELASKMDKIVIPCLGYDQDALGARINTSTISLLDSDTYLTACTYDVRSLQFSQVVEIICAFGHLLRWETMS